MQRVARLTLLFACLFTAFIVLMPFLSAQFPAYPLMKLQDVADLFTPLVLIPAYWLLFELPSGKRPSRAEMIAFLVIAAAWVEGQGMHLASNSIDNLFQGKGAPQVIDALKQLGPGLAASGVAALTYFYDEILSHYIWHAAMMAFAVLLAVRAWRDSSTESPYSPGVTIAAGVIYGIDHALMVLQGGTIPLAVPFAGLFVLVLFIWGRLRLGRDPLLTFLFITFGLALIIWLIWWLTWGCLPGPLEALHAVIRGTHPICP